LKYYEPRMSAQGPAMGFSVMATLYARLGNAQKAFEIFGRSYSLNKVPPFGVLAETAGGTNPYFATGAGGMLQAVLFGFGGLKISDEGILQVRAALPAKWKSLQLKGIGAVPKDYIVK
jgi:trehalose/maltose hydrolase-like predicted phosphorylase